MNEPHSSKPIAAFAFLAVALTFLGCSSGDPCPSGSSRVGDRCVANSSPDSGTATPEPEPTPPPPVPEPEPTCLVANAGAAKTWKAPVRVSVENDDKDNAWPLPVPNGKGDVFLPHNRYPLADRPDIQYSLYSATGWSAPALLEGDDTRGAGWQNAAADLSGNFTAVWASVGATNDVVHYTSMLTPGGSWTNPTLLQPWPSGTGTEHGSMLRGNRRGDVMVLLEKGYPQASAVANQIYMYRYSPATLWSQPTAISQVDKVGFWKRGWLGEDGNGLLAWAAGAPEINVKAPSDGKFYTRDLTATGELGAPEEHASTGYEVYKLDASGTQGYRFLAWTNKASDVAPRVLYLKTKAAGQAWGAAATMDLSGDEPLGPVLTSNARSHAYLMWLAVDKDDSTINHVRVSKWNESAAVWSDPEVISGPGMTIQLDQYAAAIDDAGNYIVSWVQSAASNQSGPRATVARMYSPATGWGNITTISLPNRNPEWPHTTMDCGGNATVTWHQRRPDPPASFEVWAARYE